MMKASPLMPIILIMKNHGSGGIMKCLIAVLLRYLPLFFVVSSCVPDLRRQGSISEIVVKNKIKWLIVDDSLRYFVAQGVLAHLGGAGGRG